MTHLFTHKAQPPSLTETVNYIQDWWEENLGPFCQLWPTSKMVLWMKDTHTHTHTHKWQLKCIQSHKWLKKESKAIERLTYVTQVEEHKILLTLNGTWRLYSFLSIFNKQNSYYCLMLTKKKIFNGKTWGCSRIFETHWRELHHNEKKTSRNSPSILLILDKAILKTHLR